MAVTLVSAPDLFALTKGGRMVYQFTGSGRYQTTGVKSVAVLFVSAAVTSGTTINIRWKGQTKKLVFTASPEAADEFTSGSGSSAYVDALIEELKGFFPFREDFIISRYDPTQLPGIVFTAKEPGPDYDLSLVNPPVGSPFTFGNTAQGAKPLLRIQYSVYVEAWLQKPGTDGSDRDAHYTRVFDSPIETDEDGSAQFDIGNILHSELVADWPQWTLAAPTDAPNSHRKYFLAYGEAYGSPLQVGRIKTDQVRHAYLGGADYVRRAGGGFDFLAFRGATPAEDLALRFGPLTRFVRPDEPQFLTFANLRETADQVVLRITLVFDDGASQGVVHHEFPFEFGDDFDADPATGVGASLIQAFSAFASGDKVCFPVGATRLGLLDQVPPGKYLKEYLIQLRGHDDAALSETYRYVLNYDYQPYTRYFVYLSSLGVAETLVTFGKGSSEINRFFEQAERYIPASYELKDGQFIEYNLATQQSFEVATGFRSQTELRSWDDFYRSAQRFHLVDGKPLPMGITSKSIKQAKDGDTLFAHLFQFVYLFRDAFYTATDGLLASPVPPQGFVPAGPVTIEQPQVINSVDPTVPDIVRGLTAEDITGFKTAAARPNPETLGFLNESAGSILFRRRDQGVPYSVLTGKPTTRDQAGLLDVPTIKELFKLSKITPRLLSFDGDIPAELQ